MTAGKTSRPTSASTTSATNIWTTAITIIATVPTAIGSGAMGPHAASTSELALDSSSPVGWRWCHSIGSERYWRVTARRLCACMRYCMTPAPSRRATMPTARSSATPRNSASTATSSPLPISPSLNAGQQDVLGRPAEHPGVGDGQGTEEQAADGGEREDPGLAPDGDPEDAEPLERWWPPASSQQTRSPNHALLDP